MKRLLILAAAFSLSGCAAGLSAIETIGSAITVGQDKVAMPASQALIVSHNAYQAASAAATAAVQAGLIKGANLDRLEQLNLQATQMLAQADNGYNVATNAASVLNIVSEIRKMVGK